MALLTLQTMIDKAARRCGHLPEVLTPEQIEFMTENLYLLLSHMTVKGLNLWKVTKYRMGINSGQKTYTLPIGTERILNINYVTGTSLGVVQNFPSSTVTSNTPGMLQTVGVKSASASNVILTGRDSNGNTVATYSFAITPGWTYFDPPVQITATWEVVSPVQLTNTIFLTTLSEIPMAPLNRDDYWNLPNKEFESNRPLQYWFNRQVHPEISLWPVCNDESININMLTANQIADVQTLTLGDTIDVPQRWYPAVQAQFAAEVAIELPGVDAGRIQYLEGKAEKLMREAADDESDDAPIYFAPNISHYTR